MTNEKLNEARAKEAMLSSNDSYHMGKFMNNLIERKYESMATTQHTFNQLNSTSQSHSFPDSSISL